MKNTLSRFLESRAFELFIVICILLNAITLGLETSPTLMETHGASLLFLDRIFLIIFTFEVLAKIILLQSRYLKDPWGIFDCSIVFIAWLPAAGALSVLRALRVLRVLRLISVMPRLKRVVSGLLSSIPGLASVAAIMVLIYYVAAVVATKLFAATFPEFFGDLGSSAYSLFQIMTLESWSMGIVRPVMEKHPYAWAFFVPYILITTFTMLNLFIAVIVNAMQSETEDKAEERAAEGHREREQILNELRSLREEMKSLRQ